MSLVSCSDQGLSTLEPSPEPIGIPAAPVRHLAEVVS